MFLRDIPGIADDIDHLIAYDPMFSNIPITRDHLPWQAFEDGYEGLVRVVQSQQISAKVADTLWFKLKNAAGGNAVTPNFVLSLDAEALKPFGMTKQKTHYIQTLAQDIQSGAFDSDDLKPMSDDEAVRAVTALKGFGPWSAQIYLMFCEQRRNILPANDLVLDRVVQAMFGLPDRPDYEMLQAHTTHWDGRFTAASLLCWAVYTHKMVLKNI